MILSVDAVLTSGVSLEEVGSYLAPRLRWFAEGIDH